MSEKFLVKRGISEALNWGVGTFREIESEKDKKEH